MMDSRVCQQCLSVSLCLCVSVSLSLCLSGCQELTGGLHTVSHGRLASSQQRLHMTILTQCSVLTTYPIVAGFSGLSRQ